MKQGGQETTFIEMARKDVSIKEEMEVLLVLLVRSS
jgi:hypothetical protein